MAIINTLNFLPQVFRTSTNQRFLGATFDHLVTPAINVPISGYIGRKFAPTYKLGDNYISEITSQRKNYQLEATVVAKDDAKNITFTSSYIDLLNGIQTHNGLTNNHQRLTTSESYGYDGHFNYDKFVNYFNYYWLPNGPDAVNVYTNEVPYSASYTVTRNTDLGGYVFSGVGKHPNLQITLARGGVYTFIVDQPGIKFWIQSDPGTSGQDASISTVSTREVFGVTNNGTESGTVQFRVPLANAQDFFSRMPIAATVDAAVTFSYTKIQNRLLSEFLAEFPEGLDGIVSQLDNKTFIFNNTDIDAVFWTTPADPFVGNITKENATTGVIATATRKSTWKLRLIDNDDDDYVMQLTPVTVIRPARDSGDSPDRVFVSSGKTYASGQFWVDNNYRFNKIPNLTATKDYLYYQDSENPAFYGVIKLVDNSTSTIDINNDILGKLGYTSHNGVEFTNGLKVTFDSSVVPSSYANNEFYVDGVGTAITLTPVDQMIIPETFGIYIDTTQDYIISNRGSQDRNPWARSNRWFHKDAIEATAVYNKTSADYGDNLPARRSIIEFDPHLQLWNYGKLSKNSIDLIIFENSAQTLSEGGTYTIRSVGTTDFTTFSSDPDFSGTVGEVFQANRDGTTADGTGTTTTDAFNDIEGKASLIVQGVTLIPGLRIVFANDYDTSINELIWEIAIPEIDGTNYITLNETDDDPVEVGEMVLITQGTYEKDTYYYDGTEWNLCQAKTDFNQAPLFDLVDADGYSFGDTTVYPDTTFAGTKFFGYPDDATGSDDVILGFPLKYQNFNNIGDIVFTNYYDAGTSTTPASFTYTLNQTTTTVNFNSGYLLHLNGLTTTSKLNAWVPNLESTNQYQLFTKFFDGYVLTIGGIEYAFVELDVLPNTQTSVPHLKVFLNNTLLTPIVDYQLTTYGIYNVVLLTTLPAVGDKIDVTVYSDSVSNVGYYEIPENLDFNPLNENFNSITLGQIRTHYNKLIENSSDRTIPIQDSYLKAQGGTLLQHSAPLIYSMAFLNDPDVNFLTGLNLARKEYSKFKNKFLSLCGSLTTIDYADPASGVDTILLNINAVKNNTFPWYYSDMVPYGSNYTILNYTVLNVRQTNYEIREIFDITQLSNRAVLIWVNGAQLIQGIDYTFSTLSPAVIFSSPKITATFTGSSTGTTLTVASGLTGTVTAGMTINGGSIPAGTYIVNQLTGTSGSTGTYTISASVSQSSTSIVGARYEFIYGDTIVIKDYLNTDGNYIPETPTKLGLYPKYTPEIYVDTTYQTPTTVIRGHDGSITPAFGDFRDDYLLDLEKRIYNNIKADYAHNILDIASVLPGRFRTTDYTLEEYNQILGQTFLAWTGANNVNYTSNDYYNINNSWTWNYGGTVDIVDRSLLQGSWRAIYLYWYDTDSPNSTPWEMLGFTSQPTWWEERYGVAPYTSGNSLLWEDLEAGYVWNNDSPYNDERYVRPGLTGFIPVDSAGNLLPPTSIPVVLSSGDSAYTNAPFSVGQYGPAETAWRRSSDYPYAMQVVLSLTKPAEYFGTQIDTSRFYTSAVTGQITNTNNQRITFNLLAVNGDTTTGTTLRTSGYINWIADGLKNLGINPVTKINNYFKNLSVQLSYKIGGFTDKNLITVSAEQTSPSSKNSSVILPDANYTLHLGRSIPVYTVNYSAVIVEKTETGYVVLGYNPTTPYFTIVPSIANNNSTSIVVNEVIVPVYKDAAATAQIVPYGTEYATIQQVADFLISYERYLKTQGFNFTQFNADLQKEQSWRLSVEEVVYWSQQGWAPGTIIVLNPVSTRLQLTTSGAIIDEVFNIANSGKLLNQNFLPIKSTNFNILRTESAINGNSFSVATLDGSSICFAELHLIQYEHILVLDNVSEFGDILYVPSQGTRQFRLKLSGAKTGGWTGALSAPGYIYNDPITQTWKTGTDYRTGDIIIYNNFYYTATTNIPASVTFNSTLWTKIQQSDIKTGLLPSFGFNSQQFENYYDVDIPPSGEKFQSYSGGLIGFRQRPYLSDLGISIPTQTKFYQGYIKQKGSLNSITALTSAAFNNITGNISLYEEWAFKVGQYGGIDSATFKEFVLDQSVFNTNPVTFVSANAYSTANVIIELNGNVTATGNAALGLLSNVYNASNLTSTSTTLYSNRGNETYINDLPNAGYINLDDADYQVFDIANFDQPITDIGIGDKIWLAKSTNRQWAIYRVNATELIATQIRYNLDFSAILKFNNAHRFVAGDILILKYFNSTYDNLYEVNSVISPLELVITISAEAQKKLIKVAAVAGTGTVYKLQSARYTSVHDLIDVTPKNGWLNNDHTWIDSATTDGWGVYTYNRPWLSNAVTKVTANTVTSNDQFGSTVRLASDSSYMYVGIPIAKTVQIFSNINGVYTAGSIVSNANSNFGSVIEAQGNIVAIGATANVHIYKHHANANVTSMQVLSAAANISTVTSITMSSDAHWLFVGSAESNRVEAYYSANVGWNTNINYQWASRITNTGSFGVAIKTVNTGTGNLLLVGASTAGTNSVGNVTVYTVTGNLVTGNVANVVLTSSQTIIGQYQNNSSGFGTCLDTDSVGGNLFVGIPFSTSSGILNGLVERYTLSSGTYNYDSSIAHPESAIGTFGSSISVSGDSKVLAVGSRGSATSERTTFDENTLIIDSATTMFIDEIFNSGVVYIFEPLIDQSIVNDLGQYGYVQELETQVQTGDQFGTAIDVTRSMIAVGAPGANSSAGAAYTFNNYNQVPAWTLSRYQEPRVNINSISRTFIFNKTDNNIISVLDYLDPAKGKVLNAVDADIDYKRDHDPAHYNNGTNVVHADYHWGSAQVGRIWWNLDAVRYIDYEQDSLSYRLNHWAERFPGSNIDVYEWIESTVLPSQYPIASGTPLYIDDSSYCTTGYVDVTGSVKVKYYFWVKNRDIVNIAAGKKNSVLNIASSIENPAGQGVPYAIVLRNNAIALYNVHLELTGKNSVLQIGSKTVDPKIVHSEYALVQEGNPQSKIPPAIQNKLIDSIAGIDFAGNAVPDPTLIPSQRYGISIRPRQTMIMRRTATASDTTPAALENYIIIVNKFLLEYPVVARKVLTTLNSEELIPSPESGEYDLVVDLVEELDYVNLTALSSGYKVLVSNDTNYSNKWTIYTLGEDDTFGTAPTRQQSYKTNLYWSYTDWYESTYDYSVAPDVTVDNTLELGKLTLVADTYMKVLDTGNGKFAVYYVDSSLVLNLIGIEDGTIQITGPFTDSNLTELRYILTAMNHDIFIDDLAIKADKIFFTMIKYILTEQKNLDWVFKTSFISATQNIRKLEQFPAYAADNQDFYSNYIDEVKPYRTVVREFIVDYQRDDQFGGDVTDFDLPAYWDANLLVYRSPTGEQSYDTDTLSNGVYIQWTNNYKYRVVDAVVERPGSGFLYAPQIVITGGGGTGAEGYAQLTGDGIANIIITNPGSGYTSAPTINIIGTGTGANVAAVIRNVYTENNSGHNVIRNIKTTIQLDRVTYTTSNAFVNWSNITTANIGQTINANTYITLGASVYQLTSPYVVTGNSTSYAGNVNFPVTGITSINVNDFDNALDRIVAFKGNITLGSIFNGIEYPGVIIDGNTFTGNVFDNTIQSSYSDNLGVSPYDVTIDGGAYVDIFASHAPEELIPGRMFDSVNIQVFSNVTPGTNEYAFRIFNDMSGNLTASNIAFHRISSAATTTLRSNLALTDTEILVADASVLPAPDPARVIPGIVFIGGEKITYYKRFTANNALGQIRRAVDGTAAFSPNVITWTPNTVIGQGNVIYFDGNIGKVTGNVFGNAFANAVATISANITSIRVVDASLGQEIPGTTSNTVVVTTNTVYTASNANSVSLILRLNNNVSANIGDYITQQYANTTVAANLRVLETVSTVANIAVIKISGTVTTLTGNIVQINGVTANANVVSSPTVIGSINSNGAVVISNRTLTTGNVWGNVYASSNIGNITVSTTTAAAFLKASPGYTP